MANYDRKDPTKVRVKINVMLLEKPAEPALRATIAHEFAHAMRLLQKIESPRLGDMTPKKFKPSKEVMQYFGYNEDYGEMGMLMQETVFGGIFGYDEKQGVSTLTKFKGSPVPLPTPISPKKRKLLGLLFLKPRNDRQGSSLESLLDWTLRNAVWRIAAVVDLKGTKLPKADVVPMFEVQPRTLFFLFGISKPTRCLTPFRRGNHSRRLTKSHRVFLRFVGPIQESWNLICE